MVEDETDMPSDKEEMRIIFLTNLIKQELAFCNRVNKYHPRNYYQWTYRQKLVQQILKPLIARCVVVQETILVEEITAVRRYLESNP